MRVVIDKSALFGLPAQRIDAICREHEVWMPEVLFYELLTTDPAQRARLFRKIPRRERPFVLVGDGGFLFGRELEYGRPVDVVRDSGMEEVRWIFNERLGEEDWFPEEYRGALDEWRTAMNASIESFRERAAFTTHAFFPELNNLRNGQIDRIQAIQRELSGNSARVREIYGAVTEANGAAVPADFGPNWIGYRLIQAELMWALEHAARYGTGIVDAPMPRLENYVCDLKYAVVASMADAFICHDVIACRLFRLVAPDVLCGSDLQEL
ncbi:hypothetical protein ACFQZQ_14545 [Lysobacter koreensis]|uniref:DUF4435 domain-containing protein n=1 Tax=Lysobacter koreensis TaxID=266122 RepID=A0ABW2YS22_9GAMM